MAHFAEISTDSIVLRILATPDAEEHRGQEFIADDLGLGGTWVQTSYSASSRNKFAAIGDTYDEALDAFVPPQPYPSWVLNTSLSPFRWEAPVEQPDSGHLWDEATLTWVQPEQPYPSWTWEIDGGWARWRSPVEHPMDDNEYDWDEDTTSWVEVTE